MHATLERAAPVQAAHLLAEIQSAFGLTEEGLGRLFGISRQAAQQWKTRGVPGGRIADVDRVAELADTLKRRLKPARLPQIIRTPGRGLGNRSILETVATFGVNPVYAYLESLYSYSSR